MAGPARVPGRLQRPHLAARDRPAGVRRLDPADASGAGGSPRRVEQQAATPRARAPPATPSGAHALQALVDGLDRDQRVAFVLTQVVGCSYAEAAEICGVPIGTIRSRVSPVRASACSCRRRAQSETG